MTSNQKGASSRRIVIRSSGRRGDLPGGGNVMRYRLQALLQSRRDKIEEGAQFQRLLLVGGVDQLHGHGSRCPIRQYRPKRSRPDACHCLV